MTNEKQKVGITYEVRLVKKFTYPKAMLEKGFETEDARQKSMHDIHKVIHEIVNNKYEDINVSEFFEIDVQENRGWKLRNSEKKTTSKVDLESIIEHFAVIDFEKKNGILSLDENPDLFEFVAASVQVDRMTGNTTPGEDAWYLKQEFEDKLQELKANYAQKLRKFNKANEDQPRRRGSWEDAVRRVTGNSREGQRLSYRSPTIDTTQWGANYLTSTGSGFTTIDTGNASNQVNVDGTQWTWRTINDAPTFSPTITGTAGDMDAGRVSFMPNPTFDSPQEPIPNDSIPEEFLDQELAREITEQQIRTLDEINSTVESTIMDSSTAQRLREAMDTASRTLGVTNRGWRTNTRNSDDQPL